MFNASFWLNKAAKLHQQDRLEAANATWFTSYLCCRWSYTSALTRCPYNKHTGKVKALLVNVCEEGESYSPQERIKIQSVAISSEEELRVFGGVSGGRTEERRVSPGEMDFKAETVETQAPTAEQSVILPPFKLLPHSLSVPLRLQWGFVCFLLQIPLREQQRSPSTCQCTVYPRFFRGSAAVRWCAAWVRNGRSVDFGTWNTGLEMFSELRCQTPPLQHYSHCSLPHYCTPLPLPQRIHTRTHTDTGGHTLTIFAERQLCWQAR